MSENNVFTEVIFSRDARGEIRVWRGEADPAAGRWRSQTGLVIGQQIVSAWTETPARSRATPAEQCVFEMNAQMKKLLGKDYRVSAELVDVPRGSIIKPMLAANYPGWGGACYNQPKLDGMRCLANIDGLWSRSNKPIVAAPHIIDALAVFFETHPRVILDGELYNHDMKDDFNGLMSICRKTKLTAEDLERSLETIEYHVYDCYFLEAKDHVFHDRSNFLAFKFSGKDSFIKPVETKFCLTQAELDNEHARLVSLEGYEGSIVRLDRAYEQKRSATLLKRKDWITEEFELVAIEEGKGNWAGYAKNARCKTKKEDAKEPTFGAGITGSKEFCQSLLNDPDVSKYESVTIRHFGMTPDGSYRFPTTRSFNERNSVEKRPVIDSNSIDETL